MVKSTATVPALSISLHLFLFESAYYRIAQILATLRAFLVLIGALPSVRCPLTELPTEVIEEILQHVDWQSLLRARASCKRLSKVSTSLSVWRGQYTRYKIANPNMAPLGAPMDAYSPLELEQAVLQRYSVEQGWSSPDQRSVSMATVQHADAECAKLHIVEGGRWLLTSVDSSVTVYDLDHPDRRGQVIIRVPQYTGMAATERTTHLSVDVLRNTSTLTFNVAISQHCRAKNDVTPTWTHFWRVTQQEGGIDAGLRAIHLTSFSTLGNSICTDAYLRDKYYVKRVAYNVEDERVYLTEIYIWEESNLHQHEKSVITDRIGLVMLRLLPKGRLLVLRRAQIDIYEIPPFATVPVFDRCQGSHITPVMSVLLPGNRLLQGGVSSVLMQPADTYSLVACTDTGIYLATLSVTASNVRLLHAITDEPCHPSDSRLNAIHLGWRRAYLRYHNYALAVSYNTRERHRAGGSGSEGSGTQTALSSLTAWAHVCYVNDSEFSTLPFQPPVTYQATSPAAWSFQQRMSIHRYDPTTYTDSVGWNIYILYSEPRIARVEGGSVGWWGGGNAHGGGAGAEEEQKLQIIDGKTDGNGNGNGQPGIGKWACR
ncbi:hypothetical protein FIBSPDRAFT_928356 [Athelia psychrophila]|uniref:F-box domain-containing protein n=1 Tax=Athelia psychrophila TaxID=1759441 RepID=A0A166QA60_9AGAM|nr:hypothetical protein FIBSPDRAFT_928356 [Fibularhizoctonia sp. CBS 109695]